MCGSRLLKGRNQLQRAKAGIGQPPGDDVRDWQAGGGTQGGLGALWLFRRAVGSLGGTQHAALCASAHFRPVPCNTTRLCSAHTQIEGEYGRYQRVKIDYSCPPNPEMVCVWAQQYPGIAIMGSNRPEFSASQELRHHMTDPSLRGLTGNIRKGNNRNSF